MVDDVRDCYAHGVVHALWQPMPGRFKDYIAQPRIQRVPVAAHHVIAGRQAARVQIRTTRCTAPRVRIAALRYKGPRHPLRPRVEVDEMSWMRQLLDWQREAADPGEFLEALRYDLAAREIFVFTPKGDVETLPPAPPRSTSPTPCTPRSATAASARGQRPAGGAGAQAGNARSSRSSPRRPRRRPSRDWLPSPPRRGPAKIKQWFAKERREEAIEAARSRSPRGAPGRAADAAGLVTADSMARCRSALVDVSALYRASAKGRSRPHLVQRLWRCSAASTTPRRSWPTAPPRPRRPRRARRPGLVVKDGQRLWVKLARCCTPVPGTIMVRTRRRVSCTAHCTNASESARLAGAAVDVEWAPNSTSLFCGHPGGGAGPAPPAVRHHQRCGR